MASLLHFAAYEATVNAKTPRKATARTLPADLADVALIDAATSVAAGSMSVSWWHAQVLAGRAPAPVIRKPRCTRWRLSEVRAFWEKAAEQAATDAQTVEAVKTHAAKASAAARAKRLAAAVAEG